MEDAFNYKIMYATTKNINLIGIQIIDGILVSNTNSIFVKNQIDNSENGIYSVSENKWVRAHIPKAYPVYILNGIENNNTVWIKYETKIIGPINL